jgi:hypothetical protein
VSINDPISTTLTRQPRARALTGGHEIPGLMSFSVSNNSYHQSDSFTAKFATSAGVFDAQWWGSQTETLLDIGASLDDGNTWKSLILGQVDKTQLDPINRTITVSGRDLTARFIDQKTRKTFQNQTSSQIVEELAGGHGMTADVTSTDTPVGRFYSADHTRMTLNSLSETTSEWDLLTFLSEQEGYDCWVTGTTIHFHPSTPPNSDPYDVVIGDNGQSNAVGIMLERSQALAKDIVVAVRSWNSKQRRGFTAWNPGQPTSNTKAQEFSFVRPNLTGDQAQDLANRIRADLSQQERLGTFNLIPDLVLDPRNLLRLRGTNSSWDQTYFIDSVTRTMSFNRFDMSVHVKNHSLESEPVTP